ncbi:hypothetical protein Ami103574_08340 [Aminipila butyrica]|uniref:Uncharacterized protein n=1 Tax=Aminipila butyrica TaxID=433296 RepID=A0A858BVA2_9FIRM|nr:hypothetical protein [Aminipila butyrica]QIB69332.1 hypothetical protein Ami103574_08340 [Aminipila butyrica]
MDMTKWIILLVVLILALVGLIFYARLRKKRLYQMFEQVFESAKQVPKQKRHRFLLFMFKESILSVKNKKVNLESRMNNPKLVETQLIQMGSILKDPSKVTDKNMKRALQMYDAYLQWEKSKFK